MKKKQRLLIVWVLILCVCAGILFSVNVSAVSAPSLFHNDERWYRDSSAGLELISGIYYIPVDIFGMFPQIELSMDSRRGEFMVYNRTTGAYISVLYNEKIATVNGEEEIYLNHYKLHGGYYYVPAEFFCGVLSLQCEVRSPTSSLIGVTMRICDGSETKTLSELLAAYDNPVSGSSSQSEDFSDTTSPPVTGTDTVERMNYLTFNTVSAKTADILKVLREYGVSATFFLTAEELSEFPESAVAAMAGGHAIALTCMEAENVGDFLAQIREANEILYGITKTETRIVQLPGGTAKSGFTDAEIEEIMNAGYVLWDWTYDVPDSVGYSAAYVASLCERAIRKDTVNVLRMGCNSTTASFLPQLLAFLTGNSHYQTGRIHSSGQEVRFNAS